VNNKTTFCFNKAVKENVFMESGISLQEGFHIMAASEHKLIQISKPPSNLYTTAT
jgi:hypothetical protein